MRFLKFAVASANSKSVSAVEKKNILMKNTVTDFKAKNKRKKLTGRLFLRRPKRGQLSPLKFKILT